MDECFKLIFEDRHKGIVLTLIHLELKANKFFVSRLRSGQLPTHK